MLPLPDSFLQTLLSEDLPYGDLTTFGLGIGDVAGRVTFSARSPLVVCCIEEAARLFAMTGGSARAVRHSGESVEPGTLLLEGEGPAESLIAAWKIAQTMVEATSGIATAVRRLVEAAERGGGAVVSCTRKNFPGTRAPSLKAVRAGGGTPHRLGLSDSVLVFPEHRVFLDDEPAAYIRRLRAVAPERKVAFEVNDVDEAIRFAEAGADVLQLEKFPTKDVAEVVRRLEGMPRAPLVAAAGGIVADNAEAYTRAGARVLVTSSPYWAKPSEVQVRIKRA